MIGPVQPMLPRRIRQPSTGALTASLKIHDLDAGQLEVTTSLGGSDNPQRYPSAAAFLGLRASMTLFRPALWAAANSLLGDLFGIAFDQLGCLLHSVGQDRCAGSAGNDEDQSLVPSPMPGP